jgi:hypothetical protein
VRAPPDNGGGRAPDRQPGRNTSTATTPYPYREITVILADRQRRVVIDLDEGRRRRVERVDLASGPYWPAWRVCWSWSAAEASRSRRSA